MLVTVGVRLARRVIKSVFVPVVLIMDVGVSVFERQVRMPVLVVLG